MRIARALVTIVCAALAQGCVAAAVAIPIAAGGVLVSSATSGERTAQAVAEGTNSTVDAVDIGELPGYTILDTAELPAPPVTLPASGIYGDLLTFSERALPERDDASLKGAYSALLANPSSVQPTRAQCESGIPAILVDLDPQGGLMPLDTPRLNSPSLRAVISHLRSRNIAIAWMTDREPTDAGRIRAILAETGLDSEGRDPLFVMRFPGEEKQRRRRALLETHCVIAMAGDDRSDFDDLFLYLRDPSTAGALDPMLGNGWFLIPNPID